MHHGVGSQAFKTPGTGILAHVHGKRVSRSGRTWGSKQRLGSDWRVASARKLTRDIRVPFCVLRVANAGPVQRIERKLRFSGSQSCHEVTHPLSPLARRTAHPCVSMCWTMLPGKSDKLVDLLGEPNQPRCASKGPQHLDALPCAWKRLEEPR